MNDDTATLEGSPFNLEKHVDYLRVKRADNQFVPHRAL
jgi:hypothetical protein